jgi:hypothetical protein
MALIPQETRIWSRVRLDRERTDLDPDDLAYALNVDLFLENGTIRPRRGREKIYETALAGGTIRTLSRVNGVRYQVAGVSLYRDATSIASTLDTGLVTSIQPYRPLNDTTTWAFIADISGMKKDNGTTLTNWGITAPTAAPTTGVTTGSLSGIYNVEYTYLRKVDGTVVAESNPSPMGTPQTLATQSLTVSVTASTDPQVTHIRVYRTTSGGAIFLSDQDVSNATTSLTSTQADNALGSVTYTDNDTPPKCSMVSAPYMDRLWLCGDPDFPHYLYYSKRFQPDAVPTDNYLELGTPDDPLQCFLPFGGIGAVFSKTHKWRVIGAGASTPTFIPHEMLGQRGCLGPYAAVTGEDGIYFAAKDGIFKTTGFSGDELLSGPILTLFNNESKNGYAPVNISLGHLCRMEIWKGRLYFSYPDVDHTSPNMVAVHRLGTTQWQFYDSSYSCLFHERETDMLLGGDTSGYVYQTEVGTSDGASDISWVAETKDYAHVTGDSPGGSLARKIYFGTKDDVDADGGSIAATTYVDGVTQVTDSLTATRRPSLKRLPSGAQGYRWRKRWTGTGTNTPRVYGTTVLANPLAG